MKAQNAEIVFLVRMWLRDGEPEWRGSVQEINSGLRFYVTGARDIADFIGARLAEKNEQRS